MADFDRKLLATKIVDLLYKDGVWRNCTQCFHWDHALEICKKYKQRPPVTVIVKGCSSFEDDEIPF